MNLQSIKILLQKSLTALGVRFRDLLPILITITFFQLFVFQQGLENLGSLIIGLVMVVCGLALFISGLEMGLFPLGEQMARDFAKKGSLFWLVAFAFSLGFGTTFAEPALIAVAQKASELVVSADAEEFLLDAEQIDRKQKQFAFVLRLMVAVAVGLALVLGVIRIIKGWPLHYIIIGGYALVVSMTLIAPKTIVGIAYDSGGVTTSTITVPLTAALGIGLASCIKGRNSLLDGFGLIAFASITPIIFVLLLGMLW